MSDDAFEFNRKRFGKDNYNYKHGVCSISRPTYHAWNDMMLRCYNKKLKEYKYYGARGISVCKRWHNINSFVEDMGLKPKNLSLDRINNNGNYKPSNCRWATALQQMGNTRKSKKIKYNGVIYSLRQFSKLFNVTHHTIRYWQKKGMSYNEIATKFSKNQDFWRRG